jgi:hypothetical protein
MLIFFVLGGGMFGAILTFFLCFVDFKKNPQYISLVISTAITTIYPIYIGIVDGVFDTKSYILASIPAILALFFLLLHICECKDLLNKILLFITSILTTSFHPLYPFVNYQNSMLIFIGINMICILLLLIYNSSKPNRPKYHKHGNITIIILYSLLLSWSSTFLISSADSCFMGACV